MYIISSKEMARLDKESPTPEKKLMELAGFGLSEYIISSFPELPVCFFCGPGNNGGDGFVAARHLKETGRDVEVYFCGDKNKMSELTSYMYNLLNVKVENLNEIDIDNIHLENRIIVECLLGTGFSPPLREDISRILEIINKKSKIAVACDIPAGVNGDTGEADNSSLIADATVTFAYPKIGHLNEPGSSFTGSLEVVDIGIDLSPDIYLKDVEFTSSLDCKTYFKRRARRTHKKDYGHVLVIGGSLGMEGAPVMSAMGALRSGAGLVTLASTEKTCSVMSMHCISGMNLILDGNDGGMISESDVKRITDFVSSRKIDSVVIGPGLGVSKDTKKLVKQLLSQLPVPVILDADGLNSISDDAEKILRSRKATTVITPHLGEFSRLTGESIREIIPNVVSYSLSVAKKFNVIVVLKGFRTCVSDGITSYVNTTGNPGMATGGSGDILSGIIASLVGQGHDALEAARIGCWVHGRAGDFAAWESSEKYILPVDILARMNKVFN